MPIKATPDNEVYIYALAEPDSGNIRYVGASGEPSGRYEQHLMDAREGISAKCVWVRQLMRKEQKPTLVLLQVVAADEWKEAEKRWIAYFRSQGAALTNSCPGFRHAAGVQTNYSVEEVAERFGVSTKRVLEDVRRQRIEGVQRATGLRITHASLEVYSP